jgi:sugar/nucleoside kinase (ribokinase family)
MGKKVGSCIVAGTICLDIIPHIPDQTGFFKSIQPGRLLAVGAPIMATGGTVSNTGLALYKLGINTQLMGKIGSDPFGFQIISLISSVDEKLASGMQVVPGEDTSYTVILSPVDADRVFLHSTGANDTFGPEDIDYDALCKADLFHFGYPTAMHRMYANDGQELVTLMRRAKETGITTSLDTSMFDPHGKAGETNWEILLKRVMPYVDIFLPSRDEILLMLIPEKVGHPSDAELNREVAQKLLDFGAGIVIIKQGEDGLYLRTSNLGGGRDLGRALVKSSGKWRHREIWAPAFEVSMVGTTGAGDCAVAGFLAAVLHGMDVESALLISAAVGACNVEAADATSGVRSWSETVSRINSGWKQHDLALSGWKYNPTACLWISPVDGQAPG